MLRIKLILPARFRLAAPRPWAASGKAKFPFVRKAKAGSHQVPGTRTDTNDMAFPFVN